MVKGRKYKHIGNETLYFFKRKVIGGKMHIAEFGGQIGNRPPKPYRRYSHPIYFSKDYMDSRWKNRKGIFRYNKSV